MESSDEGVGSAGQDSAFQVLKWLLFFWFFWGGFFFFFICVRSAGWELIDIESHCIAGPAPRSSPALFLRATTTTTSSNDVSVYCMLAICCVCVPCVARVHINNAPMEGKYWMGFSVLRNLYYTFNSPHLGVMLIHRQSALQPRKTVQRVWIFLESREAELLWISMDDCQQQHLNVEQMNKTGYFPKDDRRRQHFLIANNIHHISERFVTTSVNMIRVD